MPSEILWALAGSAGFLLVASVTAQAWRRRRGSAVLLRLIRWWLYEWWDYDRK